MSKGGNSCAVLFLVGFLDSPECGDFCDSEFEHSCGDNEISLLAV
jgi:hypothetical protein